MRVLWCWRCQADIPMLEEAEWQEVMAAHRAAGERLEAATASRRVTYESGMSIGRISKAEHAARFAPMLAAYERLTGFRETNPNAVWHHRVSLYGPPCGECGRPLRTPKARFCAACGAPCRRD
jgi:hypothetical protein